MAADPPSGKVKRARDEGGERMTHLLLHVVEEDGGRGEGPRHAAVRRRAAEECREPPLQRLSERAWSHDSCDLPPLSRPAHLRCRRILWSQGRIWQ